MCRRTAKAAIVELFCPQLGPLYSIIVQGSILQSSIRHAPFGELPNGRQATLYTLVNRNGVIVKLTDFGAIITQIHTPDRDGSLADIVLGFDSVAPYAGDSPYFGALIGRYGNRLCQGRFKIDGQPYQLPVNNGGNHLHGGEGGFHKGLWKAQAFQHVDAVGLRLLHSSCDGEEGYPGALEVSVIYELNDNDEFIMSFSAVTDRPTPVNLTQHSYFNLAGKGDVLGHELMIAASGFTPVDAHLIPLGVIAPVDGTPFDFRRPRSIGERIGQPTSSSVSAAATTITSCSTRQLRAARAWRPGCASLARAGCLNCSRRSPASSSTAAISLMAAWAARVTAIALAAVCAWNPSISRTRPTSHRSPIPFCAPARRTRRCRSTGFRWSDGRAPACRSGTRCPPLT